MQFEAFAHYARHESGKPESASCFDAPGGQCRRRLARIAGGLCGNVPENRTQENRQRLKAIDPAGIMVADKRDRIHAAIHCVCI